MTQTAMPGRARPGGSRPASGLPLVGRGEMTVSVAVGTTVVTGVGVAHPVSSTLAQAATTVAEVRTGVRVPG